MMRYALILATLAVMSHGQRSPYAGNADRRYPEVINHYRPSTVEPTTLLAQRIGEAAGPAAPVNNSPYDPMNDEKLLAVIATWPKERQPFWYINREQIKQQLGLTSRTNPTTRGTPTRTPTSGRR